ncbi:TniQ family protein [Alcanivorax sp. MD8A]|uniref:TniQ family protein n=1 Tax=Alcanivorax sp. MD8A TaxID=1177157 RepID=UPI000C9ACEC2|nr:TniQ family protein [Alcanivorax sp. MD8A]
MTNLAFLPKALPGESAGSLLLRLSQAHTERPSALLMALGHSNCSIQGSIRKLYCGLPTPVLSLVNTQNWAPSKSTTALAKARNAKKWLEYLHPSVCPDCAQEGWLPDTHDFHLITCCTRHGKQLRTHCNHCGDPVRWNRFGLNRCHCTKEFGDTEEASPAELAVARQLEEWIRSGKTDALAAYQELEALLTERISAEECWAEPAISWILGDPLPAAKRLNAYLTGAAPLGSRALVAALSSASSPRLQQALPQLHEMLDSLPDTHHPESLPNSFHLGHTELRFALGCKALTVEMLLKNQVLDNTLAKRSLTQRQVFLPELKRLYSCYTPQTSPKTHSLTLTQLAASTKRKTHELISDLLAGDLTAAPADSWRLEDWRVVAPDGYTDDVPEGYSTLAMAQSILGVNSQYIAGFRRSGLLTGHHQRNKNNRYLYKTAELHAFREKYISAGDIASLTSSSVTVITDKLRFAGIQPVSGPGIDSSPVFLFLRQVIENEDLSAVLSIKEGYSTSGRRPKSAPRVDSSLWMTGGEAAEALGLTAQQLYQLVDKQDLVATRPEHASSKVSNYFLRKQVSKMKGKLARMVTVDDLAVKCGVTPRRVLGRLWRLLKTKPLNYQGAACIDHKEAAILEVHFSRYWDDQQAAAFLGATAADIHNWKRLGHLTPLPEGHPGFLENRVLFDCEQIKTFRRPG